MQPNKKLRKKTVVTQANSIICAKTVSIHCMCVLKEYSKPFYSSTSESCRMPPTREVLQKNTNRPTLKIRNLEEGV